MISKQFEKYHNLARVLTPVNLIAGYLAGYYSDIGLNDLTHARNIVGLTLLAAGEGVGIAALVNKEEKDLSGLAGFITTCFAQSELLIGYMIGAAMKTKGFD